MSDGADLDPHLARARYGAQRAGDKFLGFWLLLFVDVRQSGNPRNVQRLVDDFYRGRDVKAAIASVGQDAVDHELGAAARLYFETCLRDPAYRSSMFGLKHMADDEIRAKIANETARALELLGQSNVLDGPASALAGLLVDGFLQALAPEGAAQLRAAIEKRPRAADVARRYLDD